MEKHIVELRNALQALAPRFGIVFAALFGSHATGRTHARSDIDVAVLADRTLSPHDIAECAYEIAALLKQNGIEVADLHGASPLLMQSIARDGIVLYELEPHAFARFQMYAYKRFVETKPLRNLRRAALEKFAAAV